MNRMPGTTTGISDTAKNSDLKGMLVRSFIHANKVPSTSDTTAVPSANVSELTNNRPVSALE